VVVDGAQGFCHAPSQLDVGYCDFYLAGCHKWLRAYHPMAIGFCGRKRAEGLLQRVVKEMTEAGELNDPLLHFSSQRERGVKEHFSETVSLSPLFSCAGAVAESLKNAPSLEEQFKTLVEHGRELEEASSKCGWTILTPHDSLRTGILLIKKPK